MANNRTIKINALGTSTEARSESPGRSTDNTEANFCQFFFVNTLTDQSSSLVEVFIVGPEATVSFILIVDSLKLLVAGRFLVEVFVRVLCIVLLLGISELGIVLLLGISFLLGICHHVVK